MMAGKKKPSRKHAALFIVAATVLWALDTLFRNPLLKTFDFKTIVWLEHLVGLAVILPWVLLKESKGAFRPEKKEILQALLVGVGGSALAGLCFIRSTQLVGPSSATLFQMLQPLVVVAGAHWFLKERTGIVFFLCAFLVVLNSAAINFPDFNFGFDVARPDDLRLGALFGLLAMLIWGSSTIAGKALLSSHSPAVVVFWRVGLGMLFLTPFVITNVPWEAFADTSVLANVLFIGAVSGTAALVLYYYGLQLLPASVVTFIELLWALGGVFVPVLFAHGTVSGVQMFGALALIVTVSLLIAMEGAVSEG